MNEKQQQGLRKVIMRDGPHRAIAPDDGWLCFKYLDGGEESISTFADISNGDVITYGIAPSSALALTPALTAYYTERSQSTGKPISQLVLQDLAALHRKRVAREEKRVWKENEFERL